MPDSFDPYREWLDVPDGPRPPDHYVLLGIQPRESDPQVIAHAADVRMAKLRRVRPGAHLGDWGRLLDHLNSVKVCLLDSASKAAYDASRPAGPSFQPAAPGPSGPPAGYPSTLAVPPGMAGSSPSVLEAPAASFAAPQQEPTDPMLSSGMKPPGWLAAPSAVGLPAGIPGEPAAAEASHAAVQAESTTPKVAAMPVTGRAAAGNLTQQLFRSRVVIAALTILVVALAGAFYYVMNREPVQAAAGDSDPSGQDSQSPPTTPAPPAAAPTPQSPQPPDGSPEQEPPPPPPTPEPDAPAVEPWTPTPDPPRELASLMQADPAPQTDPATQQPAEQPTPQVDAKKQAAFGRAVSSARASMSNRDLAEVRRHLQDIELNAQTPAERERFSRLDLMSHYLSEFWKGMRESVSTLNATQEIVLGETRIVVVESSSELLTVKAAGRLHRWAIEEIPTSVVMAIVRDAFPKDPAAKAIVGPFLAVDPKGDPGRARRMWQEASQAGVDAKRLIAELDVQPQDPTDGPPRINPPTDRAAIAQAEQSVRQIFQKPYADAINNLKKLELARELLDRAPTSTEDPTERFVMLREARDLAIASGNPALAGEAIDRMAQFYTVDALEMKAAALQQVAGTARGLSSQREIATGALDLFQRAAKAKRLDEAGRLAALALASARKCRSATLMKQAVAAGQQVEALRRQGGKR